MGNEHGKMAEGMNPPYSDLTHTQKEQMKELRDKLNNLGFYKEQWEDSDTEGETEGQKKVGPGGVQPVSRSEEEFIGLNVGGVVYMTSRRTLIRYPNSLLGVIFTANVPTPKDDKGNYMMDGDGLMFRHSLNYLRLGALSLPNDFQEHQLLKQEAAFYQLPELQGLLSKIKPQTPSKAEPTSITMTTTEPITKHFIEVYVAEEDNRPQTWRIYGGLNFLENIPTLTDYIHTYRKGSQCLEFTTQHPMFPAHTYRRFPKTTLFFHICSLGFKLHTTDCIQIFDEDNHETSWLRYMFTSST